MSRPDRLTCEELFRRLDDYLDRELSADDAALVREHLETCAICAAEYAFESSVLRNVREKLRHIQAPPGLLERISQRIREAEGGR
jgi:anti-sigma factor (TIGR02949 family)